MQTAVHFFFGLAFTWCIAGWAANAPKVVLAVHGGAGVVSKSKLEKGRGRAIAAALREALQAGVRAMKQGKSLDGVEAAIRVLEDSPYFNAGKGAVFTADGRNELDAAIMDGKSAKAGAVAGITIARNPISVARRVMEKTWHVLLSGEGADRFAAIQHLDIVDPSYFWTKQRLDELERARLKEIGEKVNHQALREDAVPDHRYGTVGAVALDSSGGLAAGTSTGGLDMKRYGRIGDSPIIGAGTYADTRVAVSATGEGEYFIRAVAAHDIAARMEYKGESVKQASDEVIFQKIKGAGGEGAVIALDQDGNLNMPFNTEGMYRGYATADGKVHVFIYRDEE